MLALEKSAAETFNEIFFDTNSIEKKEDKNESLKF